MEELKIKDEKNRQLTILTIAFLPNEPMGCFMELMKKKTRPGESGTGGINNGSIL